MVKIREAHEKHLKSLGDKKETGDFEKRLKAIIAVHQKTCAQATKKIDEKSNNGVVVVDDNNPKTRSLGTEDPKSVVERALSKLDALETASKEEARSLGTEVPKSVVERALSKLDILETASQEEARLGPRNIVAHTRDDFDFLSYINEDEPSTGCGLGSDGGAETLAAALVSEDKVTNSLSHKEKV